MVNRLLIAASVVCFLMSAFLVLSRFDEDYCASSAVPARWRSLTSESEVTFWPLGQTCTYYDRSGAVVGTDQPSHWAGILLLGSVGLTTLAVLKRREASRD